MSTLLVVCPYVPHPPTHGGSIRSRVLLQALAADHQVHVAAPVADPEAATNAAAMAKDLGLTIHALPARPPGGGRLGAKLGHWLRGRSELLQRRWAPTAAAALAAVQQRLQPALIVLDSSWVLPLVTAGTPTLLHLHNLESAMFARGDQVRRSLTDRLTRTIEARMIARVERSALAACRLAVTVSDDDRRLATTLCPRAPVQVVPNSVDLDQLPCLPPPPPGPPRLLYVGGLDYPPNLEAVTELVEQHLPALRETFPELVVRLVGRDPERRAAPWSGRPGIEVVGAVDDLLPQYAASHAVYLPIRSGGGTRIKILEAWALGRPVLSTAIGCEGLPAQDGVHLRRFESVAQGVAQLRAVLADAGPAQCRAARQLVEERFSHRAAVSALRSLVAQALTPITGPR